MPWAAPVTNAILPVRSNIASAYFARLFWNSRELWELTRGSNPVEKSTALGVRMFWDFHETHQDSPKKIPTRKKQQTCAFAIPVAAQPAIRVVPDVSGEICAHINKSDGYGGR